jgi:hypothetical protein
MVLRAVVGAVAGTVVGAGFPLKRILFGLVVGGIAGIGLRLTWRPLVPATCTTSDRLDCNITIIWTLPWFLAGWMVVAGVVLHWTLRKSPGGRDTIEVGCVLWALLSLLAWLTGLLATVEAVLPAVAYAVAGAFAGTVRHDQRSRT